MGRRPRPTKQVRIPLELHTIIEARANQRGHDITVEVEDLLRFAVENKDKLSQFYMLGDIGPLLEDYGRLKGKQRRK